MIVWTYALCLARPTPERWSPGSSSFGAHLFATRDEQLLNELATVAESSGASGVSSFVLVGSPSLPTNPD